LFLWRPVVEGWWKQREMWDGTYTFEDLLDVHEALDVKSENRWRAQLSAEKK